MSVTRLVSLPMASNCSILAKEAGKGDITYVFALRSVAPLDIAQRGVRLDDAGGDEVVEAQQVLVVAEAVEVAAAEGEGAEVLGDGGEERAGRGDAEGHVGRVVTLGVVGGFHLGHVLEKMPCGEGWIETYVVSNIALAGAAKRLDGKGFTLLHLGLVAALDDRHRFAAVDVIAANAVAVEVADALDGIRRALDLALVALHDLLDGGADV
jgi:hypothetical protein